MSVIMVDDYLYAREIVADAEKESTGAVRKGHGLIFFRHPFTEFTEVLVGDFLSDEYFHS
jgi:hypothetical protein